MEVAFGSHCQNWTLSQVQRLLRTPPQEQIKLPSFWWLDAFVHYAGFTSHIYTFSTMFRRAATSHAQVVDSPCLT
jgi:hypothetical protein